MKHLTSVLFISTLALVTFGCVKATVPPATQAAQVEQHQCSGAVAQNDEQVLKGTTVTNVTPLYGHVHTSYNDYEARVNGAVIYVKPPAGVTPDQMSQLLQCHSARALLGQIDASQVPNDPYWLPNSWVDIDVKPVAGGYAVTITADNVHNGLEVLARANSYAGKGSAPSATSIASTD
jgi:hypothetical protein